MDQQARHSKSTILDLSSRYSCSDKRIDTSENKDQLWNKGNKGAPMSEEELKIRDELENEIERDLEEEIKDGIYHLALRLHRLYQHQKERNSNAREGLDSGGKKNTKKGLSEVNISIRMEGGTKIEIKEIKKEAPSDNLPGRPRTSRSENVQPVLVCKAKKFDWEKSLRSGSIGSLANNKNIERSQNQGIGVNNKVLEWKW